MTSLTHTYMYAPAAVVALEVSLLALVVAVVAAGLVTLVDAVRIRVAAPHVRDAVLLFDALELVGAARGLRCKYKRQSRTCICECKSTVLCTTYDNSFHR